jgi:hypothetical protein
MDRSGAFGEEGYGVNTECLLYDITINPILKNTSDIFYWELNCSKGLIKIIGNTLIFITAKVK